jgi:hypothetical protein
MRKNNFKSDKKIFKTLFFIIFFVILNYLLYFCYSGFFEWKITPLEVLREEASLNFRQNSVFFEGLAGEIFTARFVVEKNNLLNWIRIIPDDEVVEIKVNGQVLPLEVVEKAKLKDYVKGFCFPLRKFLGKGYNLVEIKVINNGGRAGIKVLNTSKNIVVFIIFLLLKSVFFILCSLVIFKLSIKKEIKFLLSLSILTGILIASITDYNQKTHDVDSHIEYIEYISNNYKLPHPDSGWVYYHPPLYYILSAVLWKITPEINLFSKDLKREMLQYLSLFIWLGYSIFSILIFKEFIDRIFISRKTIFSENKTIKFILKKMDITKGEFLLIFCSTIFLFWPSNILHSIRIGNDILLYLFSSISLYYIVRFYSSKGKFDFVLSIIFSALAILTKTSGIILFVLLGIILMLHWKNKTIENKTFLKNISLLCLSFLLVIPFAFRKVGYSLFFRKNLSIPTVIVGNTTDLDSRLFVKNELQNYVWFDVKSFITEVFVNPWEDTGGRQYFWNYLFKTALFGEFNYNSVFHRNLGVLISILFLVLLIITLWGFFYLNNQEKKELIPVTLYLLFSLIAMIILRAMVPASCSNDFRYILPSLIPFCLLMTFSVSKLAASKRKKISLILIGTGIIFSLSSILFYIIP